jgi:hypothetical protein
LEEYNKLLKKRILSIGFEAEQIDRKLQVKALEIIENNELYNLLQRNVPHYTKTIQMRAKSHQVCIEKDHL